MKPERFAIRYIGFQPLPDGGRPLAFSVTNQAEVRQTISVNAGSALFSGPSRMAIQECAGICYEVIRNFVQASEAVPPRIQLTETDVSEYRDSHKRLRISPLRKH